MQKSLTQKNIVDDLKKLGLERGTVVEVHSSLRNISFVEGEEFRQNGVISSRHQRVTPAIGRSYHEEVYDYPASPGNS